MFYFAPTYSTVLKIMVVVSGEPCPFGHSDAHAGVAEHHV